MKIFQSMIFKIVVALAVILALDFFYGSEFNAYLEKLLGLTRPLINRINPCTQPIDYSLARLDEDFGISEAELLITLENAEAIWEKPLGKNLFNLTDGGALKLSLIYDYRQQATEKLRELGLSIDSSKGAYDKMKAEYDSLTAGYERDKAALDAMVREHEIAQKAYQEKVDFWNAQSGVPKNEFQKLERERLALNALAGRINSTQDGFTKTVEKINSLVNVMNRLVKELNLGVNDYNTVGEEVGQEFQEGEYVRDASGERINVYQFESTNKLLRVLAHELGHALGLEHNDDPDSIMFRLNEGKNEALTEADIQDVQTLCGIR